MIWLQSNRAQSHERTKPVLKSELEGGQCHMVPAVNTRVNADASPIQQLQAEMYKQGGQEDGEAG